MKNLLVGLFLVAFTFTATAQDKMMKKDVIQTISLEQTKGEFTQKSITLAEGVYIFNVHHLFLYYQVKYFRLCVIGRAKAKAKIKGEGKTKDSTSQAPKITPFI